MRLLALQLGSLLIAIAALRVSHAHAGSLVPLPAQPEGIPYPSEHWPVADPIPTVDRAALASATETLLAGVGRGGERDTRALVAVQGGAIVLERYAEGFDATTRFHSWSVAKSVTNAVVGILVRQGRLDVDAPADVPAWRAPDDPRGAITLSNLLRMSSGLANDDSGNSPRTVVSRMLFGDQVHYMAEFAAKVELLHPPGTHWAYSTATSNIVADIAQRTVGGGREQMLAFMREELFDPLGIRSAVPEFDGTGHFVGGVHFYANARDYARLGLLFLRDGVWDERRILAEGWVDYSRTKAPAPNNGNYAAHFWLAIEPGETQDPSLLGAPRDTFSANGAEGQFIAIVPSLDLVVVRLGVLGEKQWPELSTEMAALINAFATGWEIADR